MTLSSQDRDNGDEGLGATQTRAGQASFRNAGAADRKAYATKLAPWMRAFPVIFARSVEATSAFYERLGFERHFQLPPDGEAGYVGLRRGAHELAVVTADWPTQQYAAPVGEGARFEMFVYVDEVDELVAALRKSGLAVLCEPADMPWGERVAYVADPDGNPVALAAAPDEG